MLAVDASIAVEACFGRFALDRLRELVAPPLLWSETRSAIHEVGWRRGVTRAEAEAAHAVLERLPISPRTPPNLGVKSWQVADELGWARTYDAEYVALAALLGCRLLTVDGRLRRGADRLGFVIGPLELQLENVADYPRPPRVEPVPERIRVVFDGVTVADTTRAHRVLETTHPPVYYVPREDVLAGALEPSGGPTTFCEWKGSASYFDVVGRETRSERSAWSYPEPARGFEPIRDAVAFYCAPMDACLVGDERATPQPGGFYGGWVTSWIEGPFKGGPGTLGW